MGWGRGALEADFDVSVSLQRRDEDVEEPDEEHDGSRDDLGYERAAEFGATQRRDVATSQQYGDTTDRTDTEHHHAEPQSTRVYRERLTLHTHTHIHIHVHIPAAAKKTNSLQM